MNLISVKGTKAIFNKYNAHPLKIMGQNFLVNNSILNKVVETAQLDKKDTVLEIGPGIGTLTQALAKKTKKVIAIEKDRRMVEILKETLHSFNNIEIVQGNALIATNYKLPTHYKIVANVPYYLTSPIIRKFLEADHRPDAIVLMVQKEVAQRICAKPPDMSILAVSVQFYAKAQIISYVSKECFWPKPKVDSAIIKITPQNNVEINAKLRKNKTARGRASGGFFDAFFRVVKAGFLHPRKQLGNNLSGALKKDREKIHQWLLKNNIKPTQRAETLDIQHWINLTSSLDMVG